MLERPKGVGRHSKRIQEEFLRDSGRIPQGFEMDPKGILEEFQRVSNGIPKQDCIVFSKFPHRMDFIAFHIFLIISTVEPYAQWSLTRNLDFSHSFLIVS